MRFSLSIVCLFGFAFAAVGQEPLKDRDDGQSQKELLSRVAALEKRVEQLESMLRRQQNAFPPVNRSQPYQPTPPKTPALPPTFNPPSTPSLPPSPYPPSRPYQQPQVVPPVPQRPGAAPPPPQYQPNPTLPVPNGSVPKGWQKFEFNGQTFYIIPVDQVPASVGLRR